MDSKDVAQYLDSPLKAGCSHTQIVYSIPLASSLCGSNENCFRICGNIVVLKGKESAISRGKKRAPFSSPNLRIITIFSLFPVETRCCSNK
ncbi:Protein RAFTIN 1B [Senna tora]|uniref:Protein RAFTIN 1B n=1 Tax=Senna tora TaxID=362788 RepID=A0A834WI40_9FABA|nr:Protein RAFTIN 1B [Senna tora]